VRIPIIFAAILSAFAASGTAAHAEEDYIRVAREIEIAEGQTALDAVCFLCSVRVAGELYGDAVAIGGSVEVTGRVGGDAVAAGGSVRLGPGAHVGGEAVAVGGPVEASDSATVGGDRESAEWAYLPGQREIQPRAALTAVLVNFGLVFVAFLVARKRSLEHVAAAAGARPGLVLVTGAAVLGLANLLYVGAAYARAATALLAVFVTIWLVATIALGYAGLSLALGRRIAREKGTSIALLAGVCVWTLLQLVPLVGAAAALLLVAGSLGSAVASGYGDSAKWLEALFFRRRAVTPDSGLGAGGPT
jgi:hypothetical protein